MLIENILVGLSEKRIEDVILEVKNKINPESVLEKIPTKLFLATAIVGRTMRSELSKSINQTISENGLYHFVREEKTADLILKSGLLRSSDVFTSYGRRACFFFAGGPSVNHFINNCNPFGSRNYKNPYVNPTNVETAIKLRPTEKELKNYRYRNFVDNAVLYEGYCILPSDRTEKVKMVPDLIRDEEGKPIKDEKGEYQVAFRQAREEELISGENKYRAQKDYLDFMKEKGIEYGFLRKDGTPKLGQGFRAGSGKFEDITSKNTIIRNYKNKTRNLFIANQSIDQSAEEILEGYSYKKKNPFRDKRFAVKIAELQTKEKIYQYSLQEVLNGFNQSKEGRFIYDKYLQIEDRIEGSGIHGKMHATRVAILAGMIAYKEGILEDDSNDRIKDILVTTSYLQDIGKTLDFIPSANRSAKIIGEMDLRFSKGKPYSGDDKKMVMALVVLHEGKKEKFEKVMKKYGIHNEDDIRLARGLSSVIRDADMLDKIRMDINTPMNYQVNLNPDVLENMTSKAMIMAAYELEFLNRRVPSAKSIMAIGEKNANMGKYEKSEFDQRYDIGFVPTVQRVDREKSNVEKNANKDVLEKQ